MMRLATPVMLVRDANGVLVPYQSQLRKLSENERRRNAKWFLEWLKREQAKKDERAHG